MHVKTLENLAKAGALNGKRVLIRSDLNVPRDDEGRITNEARLVASVPAIRLALGRRRRRARHEPPRASHRRGTQARRLLGRRGCAYE